MPNASDSTDLIRLAGVGKTFSPTGDVALRDVSLGVGRGEFVCIIGPSGCGKSTLLRLIAGLETPSVGNVVRPDRVSFVFQLGSLFPWLSVAENIALGLRAKGVRGAVLEKDVLKYADMMGLGAYLLKRPRELSGGQRQRVGIARALAVEPEVLLLDEPFSALDPKTTYELHNDLLRIWSASHVTVVMVSHLVEEAVSLADRVVLMRDGTVERVYPVALPRPRHELTKEFSDRVLEIRRAFFR